VVSNRSRLTCWSVGVAPRTVCSSAVHSTVAAAWLAFGVGGDAASGTLHVLAVTGGITMGPRPGRSVVFGRNRPDVHVCVGENDRRVSRQQGTLTCADGRWWVRTTGRLPPRLPGARLLFNQDDPVPLTTGYTPLFVRGSSGREHLVEVHVQADDRREPAGLHQDCLNEVRPGEGWTHKSVEHVVLRVRGRLSRAGVAGLTRDEIGDPVGNTLNHNLVRELLETTTLVPPDLRLIGFDE
jgi:hypothetical protein